jgi:hypothetical protein
LQEFNSTLTQADATTCKEWKGKKDFVKTGKQAVSRAMSDRNEPNMQSRSVPLNVTSATERMMLTVIRYFFDESNSQLELLDQTGAASTYSPPSIAAYAALGAVVLSQLGM